MKLNGTPDGVSFELRLSAPRQVTCQDAIAVILAKRGQPHRQSQGLETSFITGGMILWDQSIYLDTQ